MAKKVAKKTASAGKKTTAKKTVAKKTAAKAVAKKKTAAKATAKPAANKATTKKKAATKKVAAKTTGKKKAATKSAATETSAAGKESSVATKKKVTTKKATASAATKKKEAATSKAAAKTTSKKAAAKKTASKKEEVTESASKPAAKSTSKTTAKKKAAAKKTSAKKDSAAPDTAAKAEKVPSGPKIEISPIETTEVKRYERSAKGKYMDDKQKEHFRQILRDWKQQLMEEVDRTVGHMKDDATNFPDPNDRATQEEEFSLELRTRDRERKLVKKINEAQKRIDDDEYGYCEVCGIEIGVDRLEARPTAELCIDCKTLEEIRERQIA